MTSNRRIRAALCALAGAVALAACGGSSGSGGSSDSGGGEQFTTAAFQKTLDAVKEQKGADAELLEVQITSAGTDYQIRDGEQATGLHFDPGSSDGQDVEVQLVGAGTLDDTVYPIADVDPAAVDKIAAAAPQASGADDFEVTVMTLHRGPVTPDVNWTVNGDGGGRTGIVLTAKPDGSDLTSPTGQIPGSGASTSATGTGATGTGGSVSTPTVPGAADAQKIAECLQNAGGDPAKAQACVNQ